MNLRQLECSLDERLAEELSLSLEGEVTSVSWYEKNPNHWVLSVIFKGAQESLLREKITDFFSEKALPLPEITASKVSDQDWVAAVYRNFPPLTIGRFYIYGSHNDQIPPPSQIPLHIEAATAFGSGQHESTEGCLKALSLLGDKERFTHPLDMGCGSGILALAMAALWKVSVLACDNDPEAVRVTLENGRKNSLGHLLQAEVSEGFSSLQNKTFDLITANILAAPLCQMARDAHHALKQGGFIILSGLLARQAEGVTEAYQETGLKLVDQLLIKEWSTLILRKSKNG
jgi:ribosomal protein L11 methyltransferase